MNMLKAQRTALEKRLIQRIGASLGAAPWSTCRRVGSLMGLAFFYGLKRRRTIALENLNLALPHLSERRLKQIARRSVQNFGMSFCEFMHLHTASPDEIRAYCQWEGLEHIHEGLSRGHGVMLTTAHFGAWEVMGAAMALEFPLTVVVRLTSNKALKSHGEKVRAAVNIKMILKEESARVSLKVLRANEGLAIFADQHAGPQGLLMPMFGHLTRVFSSPVRLALAAGAPIVPLFGVRRDPWLTDGRVLIRVSPALYLHETQYESRSDAVLAGAQYMQDENEAIVRQHPDQWLWMHRRWRPEDREDVHAGNEKIHDEQPAALLSV
jgi:KDO2-lipid IV(A) lauroyltransferase